MSSYSKLAYYVIMSDNEGTGGDPIVIIEWDGGGGGRGFAKGQKLCDMIFECSLTLFQLDYLSFSPKSCCDIFFCKIITEYLIKFLR